MKRRTTKKPPKEALKKVLELLREAVILTDPKPADVQAILARLSEMGLEDVPEWEGISSSVKQYALAVASKDRPKDIKFATVHPGLLMRADDLEQRFGLRPVDMAEMLLEHGPEHGSA